MLLRKLSPLFASVALLLLLGSPVRAQDNASCCLSTTSRLDGLLNPPKGSDEKFFSKAGGPPNVVFIVDTSSSMYAWPRTWPSTTKGCSFLDDVGYDPNVTYPALWTGVDQQDHRWFNKDYIYPVPTDGYGRDLSQAPDTSNAWGAKGLWPSTTSGIDSACSSIRRNDNGDPISSADQTECRQCLATKGYYHYPHRAQRRAMGNFLNLYAPRDSGALKVLAEVVKDLREVRFSIMAFGAKSGESNKCWGRHPSTNGWCVCLTQPMGPTCGKSYPFDTSSWENSRNSILNAISNNTMFGWGTCGTPLVDMLYAAGYYLSNKTGNITFDDLLGTSNYPKHSNFNENGSADHRSVCFDCSFNAIVMLTDGEPSAEGNVVKIPDAIKNRNVPCPGCSSSHLHRVADFLWNSDVRGDSDMPSQNRVATYTIGFAEDVADSNLLKATANAGGGKFYPARSSSELKNVILSIIDDINSRNLTFSGSAISALQVQTSSMTAVVPRMKPSANEPWTGALYRFEQFNEFVMEEDLNKDGDQEDVFLRDRNNKVIIENADGDYAEATFDERGNPVPTGKLATPFWEANDKLVKDGHGARRIWTVVDSNGDGALTDADEMVAFTRDNAAKLVPYLGIGGFPLCPDYTNLTSRRGSILDKLGLDVSTAASRVGMTAASITSQAKADELCARVLIEYIRGRDVGDADGDGNHNETRPEVLGDIFHSTPVIVEPPMDKFLCDMGIGTQCARTLYSDKLGVNHTPVNGNETINMGDCGGPDSKTVDAYEKYQFLHRKRERVILVGANDGMLHAFSDGVGKDSSAAACAVEYPSSNSTGEEIWAFIPPDQLPRLYERMLEPHRYFVDGDTMVREVWAGDLNNNGFKDHDEYKVLVVGSEGRGGNHYFALELVWGNSRTNFEPNKNAEAVTAVGRPGFRWMYPQPCSEEATRFGKTIYSLAPKAPPIGPVLLQSTTGVERYGVNTTETWVVMLSGGWSPAGERGRGIYMVDAWSGQVAGRKDNLIWKWEFDPDASGAEASKKAMTYGIMAPVAMVDYGPNSKPKQDGFFDTAVVGDMGGQLWTFRFFEPGVRDPNTGLVINWSGGRSFQMDRDGVRLGNSNVVTDRQPIHYLASIALQQENGALRAFVGTGDRYSVLDTGVGTCRFDNPVACSKLGCGDTKVESLLNLPTGTVELENHWGPRVFTHGQFRTPPSMPANFCGSVNDPDYITARFGARYANSCPMGNNSTENIQFAMTEVECGRNETGAFACRQKEPGITTHMGDLQVNPGVNLANLGKNRYYGLWAYGGKPERMFDENPSTPSDDQTAAEFDNVRLTDTGTFSDLVNVSAVNCTATGCTGQQALPGGYGWFYEYSAHADKTATGSAIISSCVLWNSVYPESGTGASACSSPSAAKARLYQADFITGAPNCAAGFEFARYMERDAVAPPTEPTVVTQVSKTGKVQIAAVLNDGSGAPQKVPVTLGTDVLQSVYELPVSRALHDCRHEQNGECAPVGP